MSIQDSVIARFPIAGARRYKNCLDVEHIDLHCVCRMPYYDSDSEQEDLMVMCDMCNKILMVPPTLCECA